MNEGLYLLIFFFFFFYSLFHFTVFVAGLFLVLVFFSFFFLLSSFLPALCLPLFLFFFSFFSFRSQSVHLFCCSFILVFFFFLLLSIHEFFFVLFVLCRVLMLKTVVYGNQVHSESLKNSAGAGTKSHMLYTHIINMLIYTYTCSCSITTTQINN